MTSCDILVIGAGAAGIFAAIHAGEKGKQVIVLEKSQKTLSKVRISGGGRCNLTHRPMPLSDWVKNYPRGGKKLKQVFKFWDSADTMDWFTSRGVSLKIEDDGRVFPVSDYSGDVANALLLAAKTAGVTILTGQGVEKIEPNDRGFEVRVNGDNVFYARSVIVATGGSPTMRGMEIWKSLGLKCIPPVPSLFTFNIPERELNKLMGLSVNPAKVYLPEHNMDFTGPVLITHWGLSGPAVLKLSAFAARLLAGCNYKFVVRVQWVADQTQAQIFQTLEGNMQLGNFNKFALPQRLWLYLCARAGVSTDKRVTELSGKDKNKLAEILLNDRYQAIGKSTFKEEFVTAGGIDLGEIDLRDFSAKKIPGLHFVGEVLDIDGITGGFNFQAAWAAGKLAGEGASDF
ncbi:MAG: NAD(P)/FAD-dependent oxidoreductase [Cryomorphaceae bacterium]|nr:NAD(P)/FAD-dependent oxidoreductase [Cryomorphaceae bacterium]